MSRRAYDVSEAQLLFAEAPEGVCKVCGANLWIRWHDTRFVHRLDGVYQLVTQPRSCPAGCPGQIYRPPVDIRFVLPKATYGTDVVVEVGERHLRGGASLRAIGRDLNARGVPVTQRHTCELFRSYVALTKLARGDDEQVRQRLLAQGGLLLMADGVQFDDASPVLYLIWDALSGQPLFGERRTFKGKDDLASLLERVKALNVPILGVVSDKEKGLLPAIKEVFPDAPHQVCQNHFLKNCAAGMASDLKALGSSVEHRAEEVRKIASRLHQGGANSVEWEVGAPIAGANDSVEPAAATAQAGPISEDELAAELCAMTRHAARAAGRAPLEPPELVRHERLELVRAAVQDAARKGGAHTRSSSASTRR
jgi:hypothetical protein